MEIRWQENTKVNTALKAPSEGGSKKFKNSEGCTDDSLDKIIQQTTIHIDSTRWQEGHNYGRGSAHISTAFVTKDFESIRNILKERSF